MNTIREHKKAIQGSSSEARFPALNWYLAVELKQEGKLKARFQYYFGEEAVVDAIKKELQCNQLYSASVFSQFGKTIRGHIITLVAQSYDKFDISFIKGAA